MKYFTNEAISRRLRLFLPLPPLHVPADWNYNEDGDMVLIGKRYDHAHFPNPYNIEWECKSCGQMQVGIRRRNRKGQMALTTCSKCGVAFGAEETL